MRIFNTSTKSCVECPFFMCDSAYTIYSCGISDEILNNIYKIHKDCPFNKPLIKEDIENFGYEYTYNSNDTEQLYTKDIDKTACGDWIYEGNELFFNYDKRSITVIDYLGTVRCIDLVVNNKPELEFILKSLNIID